MNFFAFKLIYRNPYRYIIGIFLLILSFQASAQLAGYGYIARITIDHNQVSGTADLSNFPVLINHTDPNLRTTGNGGFVTNANGYDIAFTSSDGVTQLDHEIEKYDATTGEYIAWVRIPTLAYDVDTDIYLYYGNSSVVTDPSNTNTWDANYQGVWHLIESGNGTANEYDDGTSNNNDGQGGSGDGSKTPVQSTGGKIGNAQDFDGSNDYIDLGFINQTSATVSIWAKSEGNGDGFSWQDMIGSQAFGNGGFLLFLDPEATGVRWRTHIAGGVRTISGGVSTSDWHLYTGTVSGGTSRVYIDGVLSSTNTSANMAVSPNKVAIGDDAVGNNNGFFDGLLDEARISNIARSADWITTEFNNQNDPLSFYTVSSPGGVSTDLALWLIADVGTTGSPTVTSWANQRGIADVSTASGDPQLVNNSINFNLAIDFDATGDYFSTANSSFIGNDNPYSKYVVIVPDVVGGSVRNLIGTDATSDLEMRLSIAGQVKARHAGTGLLTGSTVVAGQPVIAGLRYGVGGPNNVVRVDGVEVIDNTTAGFTDIGTTQIGGRWGGTNLFDGQIAEAIIYTSEVPDADIPKIESYLAIKYGITLDNTAGGTAGDYQDSDGTILWDASVNSTYHNDVAGIGKDFKSLLHQTKSISANSDAMMIIDKGGAFSNDQDFILWGNDNGPTAITSSGAYPKYFDILQRTWKVSVTGAPGAMTVRMIYSNTGNEDEYGLLVDDDADFTSGVTSYTASSISGDTVIFTNVNLSDGEFLSLGIGLAGPGGVNENMALWLKANAGTNTTTDGAGVSLWADMGADDNNVSQGTPLNQPFYRDNATDNINFNPVVDFDGTDDVMSDASGILGSGSYNDINVYSVVVTDQVKDAFLFKEATTDNRISVTTPWGDNNYYWDAGNAGGSDNRLTANWGGTTGTPYLWSSLYSTTLSQTVTGDRQVIERNGLSIGNDATAPSFTGNNSTFSLGSDGSNDYNGKIAEMVIYTGTIDATQHNQIESYLAIKYSISLSNGGGGTAGDYVDSDGTLLWDADSHVGYHNDVVVIGRDDDSDLLQKQSHQLDDSLRIFIDVLASDNASNAGTISNDNSFIAIGHNGAKQRAQNVEMPPGVVSRFGREWKVTNTNFDEDFSLEIEWDNTDAGGFDITMIRLLVDTDDDFSDATILSSADGLTFANGSIIVGGINSTTHIPKNSTSFITIASVNWGVPLPIELISFDASVTNKNTVELSWQTASEINNDFFTIERSKDAEEWKELKIIDGAGNSTEKLSYSFEDTRPYSGISYYRLKQTDFDGQFTYSDIKVVTLGHLEENELKVYPNPSEDLMTIEGNKVELTDFVLYNIYGQNVRELLMVTDQSASAFTIDVSRLSNGIYTLKTKNHIRKIIKQ